MTCDSESKLKIDKKSPLGYYLDDFISGDDDKTLFTGSRAFGLPTINTTDYDLVITYTYWDKIKEGHYSKIYFDRGYGEEFNNSNWLFNSIHLLYEDKDFNLIVTDNQEFLCWRFATNIFLDLLKRNGKFKKMIESKESRVIVFESLKKAYRYFYCGTFEGGIPF